MHLVPPHFSRTWRYGLLLLAGSLSLLSGCQVLMRDPLAYSTVQADPQHDTAKAIRLHEKALKVVDRYMEGKVARLDKAEEILKEALIADVTYGPAHNTLGTIYFLKLELYLAAWEFEYAAKVMPEQAEPLYNLGMVYECASRLDRAIEYYELAYTANPTNPNVIGSLARARLRNEEPFEDVRVLLQQLVFYDTRPDWVEWACDQLGVKPYQIDKQNKTINGETPEIVPPGIEGNEKSKSVLQKEELPSPSVAIPNLSEPYSSDLNSEVSPIPEHSTDPSGLIPNVSR